MTIRFGLQVEEMFRDILTKTGIRQAEGDFNAEDLLGAAERVNPFRLRTCAKHYNPALLGSAALLDRVFGIDHMIDVAGTDKVYAAIDLTVNGTKVGEKLAKALRLKRLWRAIGVQHFFVVKVLGDPDALTPLGTKTIIDSLWSDLEKAFSTEPGGVHKITITIC